MQRYLSALWARPALLSLLFAVSLSHHGSVHAQAEEPDVVLERLAAELKVSFDTIDNLFGAIDVSYAEVDKLVIELEKDQPVFEGILESIPAINSATGSLDTTRQALVLFGLSGGDEIYKVDPDRLDACIYREAYANSLSGVDGSMVLIIEQFNTYENRIPLEEARFIEQDLRVTRAEETLEKALKAGAITEDDADVIEAVLDEIGNIYSSVLENLDAIEKKIEPAKTPYVDRQVVVQEKIAYIKANPKVCWHLIAGGWFSDDYLGIGLTSEICVQQTGFDIKANWKISRGGAVTKNTDLSGKTEGTDLKLTPDDGGPELSLKVRPTSNELCQIVGEDTYCHTRRPC